MEGVDGDRLLDGRGLGVEASVRRQNAVAEFGGDAVARHIAKARAAKSFVEEAPQGRLFARRIGREVDQRKVARRRHPAPRQMRLWNGLKPMR